MTRCGSGGAAAAEADFVIEPLSGDFRERVKRRTYELFGGEIVVSRGNIFEPASLSGFVAIQKADSKLVGILTYRVDSSSKLEVVTLDALEQFKGIGSALMKAVEELAVQEGIATVYLITTNDNIDALRFYQRRGYRMVELHPGAVESSRLLKPTIPKFGSFGIEILDEIVLEKKLS